MNAQQTLRNQNTTEAVVARPRPLRVAHMSLTLRTGGQERLLVDFARHRNQQMVSPEFIAMNGVGQPAEDIESAGCPVHFLKLNSTGKLGRLKRIRELLQKRQIDLLHTHNSCPHLYGTLAARSLGIPVVHTRHGRRFGDSCSERFQFRWMSHLTDRIVAVSDDTGNLCRTVGHLKPIQLIRIWNGIDEQKFAFHGPVAKPIAITVGRLAPEKGYADLIQAASHVRDRVSGFRLLIVGDGPERSRLEALVTRLQLEDCVQLLGERSDVAAQLQQAALYVCSSHTEGLSLTLLEAMASGLPVVATDVGGNSEVVDPGQTGVLVPAQSPQSLAREIEHLCDVPDVRNEMGTLARARVETHFSIRQMVATYESLYQQIIEARKEGR